MSRGLCTQGIMGTGLMFGAGIQKVLEAKKSKSTEGVASETELGILIHPSQQSFVFHCVRDENIGERSTHDCLLPLIYSTLKRAWESMIGRPSLLVLDTLSRLSLQIRVKTALWSTYGQNPHTQ